MIESETHSTAEEVAEPESSDDAGGLSPEQAQAIDMAEEASAEAAKANARALAASANLQQAAMEMATATSPGGMTAILAALLPDQDILNCRRQHRRRSRG